jgi:hypothetical protein
MAKRFRAQPRAGGATPCCWSAVITGSDTRSYDLGLLGIVIGLHIERDWEWVGPKRVRWESRREGGGGHMAWLVTVA